MRMVTCKRCKQHRQFRARGLCGKCYEHVWYAQELDAWPSLNTFTSAYCTCVRPLPEWLAMFGAWQCGHCSRKLIMPHPGSELAVRLGCKCPRAANNDGLVPPELEPDRWWVSSHCALHWMMDGVA